MDVSKRDVRAGLDFLRAGRWFIQLFTRSRKTISIELIDRDQYQRNETFAIRLGEPSLVSENEKDDDARMSPQSERLADDTRVRSSLDRS